MYHEGSSKIKRSAYLDQNEAGQVTNILPVIRAKTAFRNRILQPEVTRRSKERKHIFILSHFKYKECVKFVPDPNKPPGPDGHISCYCGELDFKHQKYENIVSDDDKDKWTESIDIRIIGPTNAFGQIKFSDSSTQKPTEVNCLIALYFF
ncbi:Transient receptor potential cation channel trpm [Schistosoma japonicum]|nr:Transient receptor potential cation channel trpm [Schistosoma japonicum]